MDAVTGMDRNTGRPIAGVAHLKQSIGDILSTRRGSRRERPDYGSDIPRMVDLPVTRGWISTVQAEAARAIGRWEPRIRLSRVSVLSVLDARVTFRIQGIYLGSEVLLEVTT
ncbi:GPW/gp25 family protein [Paraburkholderia sp. D15]|uniref:GPW/gp25 family protein n=1 Tax=Paraburkholderia sp. D15 TaxID=2880218 RepID=UPI002478A998|nr:GPW/gp25 family protein [Paraburkholderia sp. D15]WGS50850.1 GPW/gp25 family protein [Paraburkholderia sp. D15]